MCVYCICMSSRHKCICVNSNLRSYKVTFKCCITKSCEQSTYWCVIGLCQTMLKLMVICIDYESNDGNTHILSIHYHDAWMWLDSPHRKNSSTVRQYTLTQADEALAALANTNNISISFIFVQMCHISQVTAKFKKNWILVALMAWFVYR